MRTPAFQDLLDARERIRHNIVLTPCTKSQVFEDLIPGQVFFKFENLQRTGSFKDRGSLNRLMNLSPEERSRGVITASAGNHAQALAYHAGRFGIPATVVMPEGTPLIKVSNTRQFGGNVLLRGVRFDDSVREAQRISAEDGNVMIHAFDDVDVIAGQGSIGLELVEQVPDLDTVLVPIGGGGLISGIALAVKELKPEARIIGVEAEAAPSARTARDRGEIVEIQSKDTLADGIAVKKISELTFPIMEEFVDDIVVVSEEEIASAVLLLLEREKTVVEGAGAVALAALLTGKVSLRENEVAVPILSGGNIDINMISRIIARGLVSDGRLVCLRVKVPDRPGNLAYLTRVVAEVGANVMDIVHRRAFADISVGDVEIVMQIETRGRDHVGEIISALETEEVRVYEVVT